MRSYPAEKQAGLISIQLNRLKQLPAIIKGIALALLSSLLLVIVGVLVRKLNHNIDIFQILLFRQFVFILLLLPLIRRNITLLTHPNHIKLHLLRVFGAFFALYFGFVTISNIPLTDATALGFSKVLFVAIISRLFLSEKVDVTRLFTIVIGFIGVLMVVQPNFSDSEFVYLFTGLLGAAGASIAVVCIRKLSQSESRIVLMAYQAIFVALIALIPSLLNWHDPSTSEYVLMLSVGVVSAAAQWLGISAYKCAEANIVANVEYVKILYSLILGYCLFAEMPNSLALLGAMVIIASALIPLYLAQQKRNSRKRAG